ncbi:MAG: hypothetical protein IJ588_07010 [Prevotella sp.]|nr:hypothetical protein [Prevotella sp.]
METANTLSVEKLARMHGISGIQLSPAVSAYYIHNALAIIRMLEKEVLPVAQVNAYSLDSEGPHFQGSLCCNFHEGESWSDYTKRSYKESVDFIKMMESDGTNRFGYVFTTYQP